MTVISEALELGLLIMSKKFKCLTEMASWSLAATFVHFGYFVFYIPMLNSGLEIVRLTHIFADSYFLSLCNITKNKHRFISRKRSP